ncbi:MAG: hypothetical protein RMI04_09375 [Thermofilaceae archaeon]|nr:hypothetical protein [Thermofilaceae archaeon]
MCTTFSVAFDKVFQTFSGVCVQASSFNLSRGESLSPIIYLRAAPITSTLFHFPRAMPAALPTTLLRATLPTKLPSTSAPAQAAAAA